MFCLHSNAQQQVTVNVDANAELRPISPYLFGKNNCLSDNPADPLSSAEWQQLRDLGIRMFRENGGNNSTKYNWRKKLSSHPNWYNNVYPHDWDYATGSIQSQIPSAQVMWAFQLAGKAAETMVYNFNDWTYNGSQWWEGVEQNLCGGGQVNPAGGSDALTDGNPDLYLENWTADSTVMILDHWFAPGGRGLDSAYLRYWDMDNEPEIWQGTHDDIWPIQPDAETFMQMYFDAAKKAREKYPGIKLMGPVPANEWQWYNWNGSKISYKGNQYVWLEYFILRVAEEQQISGIRLLDVLDIHFYPAETVPSDIVQLHRVFFDENYNYPGANGVKRSGTGIWDNSITKEYIFKRCNNWLEVYMGPEHGVKLSVSEIGIEGSDPNVTASWYASTIGEFVKNGVAILTPWTWKRGMNEVLHLFSNYTKDFYIEGTSSQEMYLSSYPTISGNRDSLTVFIVNRHLTESGDVTLNLDNFPVRDGIYKTYQLYNLPLQETFVSHSVNALRVSDLTVTGNHIEIQIPALSVTAIVLHRAQVINNQFGFLVSEAEAEDGVLTGVTVTQSSPGYSGTGYVTGFDNPGDKLTIAAWIPENGFYKLVIRYRCPDGPKIQNLLINNKPLSVVSFLQSDSFVRMEAGNYMLQDGMNQITISNNYGWTDIDKIEIYPAYRHIYAVSQNPVDSLAGTTTKMLYDFLRMQFGERIISGQTHDYYDEITDTAGEAPMIRDADFQRFTEGYPYLWDNGDFTFGKDDDGSVDALIDWYLNTGKKGIISYQWHWHSPEGGEAGTNTFYTSLTTFDVSRAVTPGTQEYDDILRDIDDIATELKKFQVADIPVLWRPLHEAGGGWFWWGAQGPEPCKELYNIMFDRLKNYHQLHNLIWVWSTPEADWYPGNDKVDIIGYDSYPGVYNYGNQKFIFDELFNLTRGEKLIALTENGPIPDPDECLEGDAPWLYFMSWNNLVFQHNSYQHIQDVYHHPKVITLESDNIKTGYGWRSSLYPADWKPGYKDNQGRFLHDFSYAGYHSGESEIPYVTKNITDVTLPPYNADNTGSADVTAIIQQAIDDVGKSGGGVVYLPAGIYKIKTTDTSDFGLLISCDSTILRGAGPGVTFLLHDQTYMRHKDIIRIQGKYAGWFYHSDTITHISVDLPGPSRILPVESVTGYHTGDQIIVTSEASDEFISEHNMTGIWTAAAIKGVAYLRRIDSVDTDNNLIITDAPTRYYMKTRDHAGIYHAVHHISECGIENLSIGNIQNPKTGWDEESYAVEGTGAWDVHFSHALQFINGENCWVKNVHTFKPASNTEDVHLLSNGLLLNQCRFITIDSCRFEKSQYEGGGGNGYMFTLQSNDCLIKNSVANHGRHNYDFKYPFSNGNVILHCRAEDSKYASDFHMYLSMANLFDACTVNGDYFESVFRPYGGDAIHGYSSTQSVFYNTKGEAYHADRDYIVESRQFGNGYIIGTSGPARNAVNIPVEGMINNYYYNTMPRDLTEGVGRGEDLIPQSLYLDQLSRRLSDSSAIGKYDVGIIVKDSETDEFITGCKVRIFNESAYTNENGYTGFGKVLEVFVLMVENDLYFPFNMEQIAIYSDTTLLIHLMRKTFNVKVKLYNNSTLDPLSGADFTLNGIQKTSNSEGEITFSIYGGNHIYSINKTDFQEENGSLDIRSDTSIDFHLIQLMADLKFRLKEGMAPLNNALIILNGDSLLTNSLGIALFKQLSIPDSYNYVISKAGFRTMEGSVYLAGDTTVDLTIDKLVQLAEAGTNIYQIRIWPNPVKEFLHCSIPENSPGKIIKITNIYGDEIFSHKVENTTISLNVKDYPEGIYLIQLLTNDNQSIQIFIKN